MEPLKRFSFNYLKIIFYSGITMIFGIVVFCLSPEVLKRDRSSDTLNKFKTSPLSPQLRFEKNAGQTVPEVDFLCRGKNNILYLTAEGPVIKLSGDENAQPLCIEFMKANRNSTARGVDQLRSTSNYFIGNDPDKWFANIPHYARVKYDNIYKGIDLVYYIRDNQVEFDFIVKPRAETNIIHLSFSGTDELNINSEGDLIVKTGSHELIYRKPVAWQNFKNKKHNVKVRYAFADKNEICFDIEKYDKNETLIIDPQFVYSTYLGGSAYDVGYAIAVDEEGCAYVAGSTYSTDFPTYNAFQSNKSPGMFSYLKDAFVTKFNPEGTDIIFSTYLGGNWDDDANAIAVDRYNYIYITGTTSSKDDPETEVDEGFPLKSAYQDHIGDKNFSDAFVTVLNNNGSSLYYSTYFGGDGEDTGEDIAVSSDGHAFITGTNFSFDLPVKNAYMSSKPSYYYDAFVAKLNPHTSGENSLVYSTYLGGNLDDYGYGIAVDQYGCAYVTGTAKSTDFPTTSDAIQATRKKGSDVFVTKYTADGLSLDYSTYLGSDGSDEGKYIEVDTAGCAYVCGYGGNGFPTTPGAFMTSGAGSFVSKLLPDGSDFAYSTLVRTNGRIAVDDTGQVYIATSYSRLVGDVIKADAFVTALNPEGSDTLFAMIFGGSGSESAWDIALDADRNMYIVGHTNSTDFPTENAYQVSLGGSSDAFVAKIKKPKTDELIVEVLQDPLNYNAIPIPNTPFDIYAIDLNDPDDPYTFLESRSTDDNGLLHLPAKYYSPGMPIFIRYQAETKDAAKSNHSGESKTMLKVDVDNLIIDNNGNIEAQYLETDANDTTRTYLSHTSIGYNLLISIEWLASVDYTINLLNAFMHISNILYDVTNGQAYINHVTIYDNKKYWNDADIKIFSSNLQWPKANPYGIYRASGHGNIYLPPIFYDTSKIMTIQKIYEIDTLNPAILINTTAIVHELGHYLFGFRDEYENASGTTIFRDINFSFMDRPDYFDDPMSTEMSDYVAGDLKFSDYTQTEHYSSRLKNGWDLFKSDYSKFYGPVRAYIHSPKDLGISSDNVMSGPNSDLDFPDLSVGSMMGHDLNVTTTTIPRRDYLITAPITDHPVSRAKVRLKKKNTGKLLDHGVTTKDGHIKLFNTETGDTIFVASISSNIYAFREIVVNAPATKAAGTADIIQLRTVSGDFSMLSGLTFDASGKPAYQCTSDPQFTSSPAITVYEDDKTSDKQVLTAQGGTYTSSLNNTGFSEGSIFFTVPDNLDEKFFINQDASVLKVSDMGQVYYNPVMLLELTIDDQTTTAEKISLLSSDFPAPQKGLPDSVLRVSDVICLNTFPGNSDFNAKFQIHYYADSLEALVPEAMTLYKWENDWSALKTNVDLEHNTVTADIDGPGYYAAFMDLTQSSVITNMSHNSTLTGISGFMLYPNSPNPFGASTNIRFKIPIRSKVRVDIYDINGRKIQTLVNNFLPSGDHAIEWNGENNLGKVVTSGIYICVLKTENITLSQKMLLIHK